MDHDYDGSMGRAMALSYAEEQGKKAQRQAGDLAVRLAKLEDAFVRFVAVSQPVTVSSLDDVIREVERAEVNRHG